MPINMLIPIPGTPLADAAPIDPIEFVRTIALARIMMPRSHVRLSAGRTEMSDEMQALCFFAGANSIFVGDTLLTADNPGEDQDSRTVPPARHRADGTGAGAVSVRGARPLRRRRLPGLGAQATGCATLAPRAGRRFRLQRLSGARRLRRA